MEATMSSEVWDTVDRISRAYFLVGNMIMKENEV